MKTWAVVAFLAAAAPAYAGGNLLKNGSFETWTDGPVDWKLENGVGGPEGKASVAGPGPEGGISLMGDASTRLWRIAKQEVRANPGGFYSLRFEARVAGLKLEEKQSDNAWVGFITAGQPRRFESITSTAWTSFEVVLARPTLDRMEIGIFLSKTGTLEVRGLVLEELFPQDSYDYLVRLIGRRYGYLEFKKLDWPSISGRFQERFTGSGDEETFVAAAKELLGELKDLHVTIRRTDGRMEATFTPETRRNCDLKAVMKDLKAVEQIGKLGFAGRTPAGYAYIEFATLVLNDNNMTALQAAIDSRLDAPGFLVDLRANAGGDERRAMELAGVFADRERVYALEKPRAGPKAGDFGPPLERKVIPRAGRTFTKPVVCLIGPGCASSAEEFAMMMKAFPHVTLVGQPTRGASARPRPFELPNGLIVNVPIWVDLLPDGTVPEGAGVQPEILIAHEGEGDPTYQAAVEELRRKIEKAK